METITILFIASVILNVILGAMVALQKARAVLTVDAMSDLLKRVASLEVATKVPQKVVIFGGNGKENPT